ncbi:hypothetical protein BB387_01290 [Helicobacter pylori]|nr:hypothetical protein BB387_01290 [Helicobacter pylori]
MEKYIFIERLNDLLYNRKQWLHSMRCLDIDSNEIAKMLQGILKTKEALTPTKRAVKSNKRSTDD